MELARKVSSSVLAGLLAFWAVPAVANDGPYEGQQIVRVVPTSQAQLDAALANAEEEMACVHSGVGPLDLRVTPEQLVQLREIGLDPVVLVADIQREVDDERRAIDAIRLARGNRNFVLGDDTFYENFHPLADIHARMNQLAQARPDLARYVNLGQSYEGRDIPALVITGPGDSSNRPAIIWQGTQHAREWVSPATVLYLAEYLAAGYDSNPRVRSLVANVEFWIVPIVNPDGYEHSWVQGRLWRKNRRDNSDHGERGNGVDLNRNWGFGWGGPGAESSGGGFTYHGPSAFSESESRAVRDVALSLGDRLKSFIDYHSYSQLILLPWGYINQAAPPPDDAFFDQLGQDMAIAINNETGAFYNWGPASITLYIASGVAPDWFYGELGVPGITVELRDRSTFLLPPDQILPCARENFQAALVFAESTVGPLPTADLNSDGAFNNTDINLYINAFTSQTPIADLNGDGVYNNTDINLFINMFLIGI